MTLEGEKYVACVDNNSNYALTNRLQEIASVSAVKLMKKDLLRNGIPEKF